MPFASHKPTAMSEQPVVSAARTAATGDTGPLEGYGNVATIRAQLNVTGGAGAPGTLAVFIEDSLDGGSNWNTIAEFAAVKSTGREVLNVPAPFGDTVRVRWTITPDTEPTPPADGAEPEAEDKKPSYTFAVDWALQATAGIA